MTISESDIPESLSPGQSALSTYLSPAALATRERQQWESEPTRQSEPQTSTGAGPDQDVLSIDVARRADYVGFLHRAPFATEAYQLGFVTDAREDCRIQDTDRHNVEVPILMLDNEFNRPDLERYLSRFREVEPEIGVVGDAFTPDDAHGLVEAARDLKSDYPDATLIIVPKCRKAIDIVATVSSCRPGSDKGTSLRGAHSTIDI